MTYNKTTAMQSKSSRPKHKTFRWLAGAVIIFALLNLATALAFQTQTYPGARVGNLPLGSVAAADFKPKVAALPLLPQTITVAYQKQSTKLTPRALGLSVQTADYKNGRAWLPVLNFVLRPNIAVNYTMSDPAFTKTWATLKHAYEKQPVSAMLTMEDYLFVVKPGTVGVQLNSVAFKQALVSALYAGSSSVQLPVEIQEQSQSAKDLEYTWQQLVKEENTALTYNYTQHSRQLTAKEVGHWYVPTKKSYAVADDRIRDTINQIGANFGITVENMPEALAATKAALSDHQALAFTLGTTTAPVH